jgi:hypothetical protein
MARRSWLPLLAAAFVATLLLAMGRPAQAADATASEELYQAFHACEEGMQDATTPARRLQLLGDYRIHRSHAVRADANVLKAPKARDYAVREWLVRCDATFPKLAAQGRKQAAQMEADAALAQCRTATDRGTLEDTQADYKAFKENKDAALRHDPKSRAKRDLVACDRRVAGLIAKRRHVDDSAIAGIEKDALKVLADARREQDDSLGGTRDGATANLSVAIPSSH